MRTRTAFAFAAAALAAPSLSHASDWTLDSAHSAAHFSVRHLMVSNVRGEMSHITGAIHLDDKDVSRSTVEATIDATTINTREEKRDQHLKSPDFFDVAKFPTLTFKSKKVARAGKGHLKVTGDLTLHGVTREVTLDVQEEGEAKDPWGNVKAGYTATTRINRKDFGLTWNKALETGGVVVGDEVAITIDLEATKAGVAAAR
jgi:polyisoprenoid-binding protein YceI